jgi:dolichol-phosphate mannosyltransferase
MAYKNLIIIPTYNERENIERIINEVFRHLPDCRILVVDDSSPDGTADIIKRLQKENSQISLFSRQKKEGLGKAYIDAFKYCFENFSPLRVVMMDADMSHHPKYLPEMEKKFSQGVSVVIGSRYVPGGNTVGWEWWRKNLSYYGNLYAKIITRMPVNDLTAGFYMINADLLRSINFADIDSSGYAFQIELKYNLKKKGGVFVELPIVFGNRIGGESKISSHIISEGIIAPWKIFLKK